MPGVLFWNVGRKPLLPRVARLAAAHAVDVVALAECSEPAAAVAAALGGGWAVPFNTNRRFRVVTRVGVPLVALEDDNTERVSVWRSGHPDRPDVLLGIIHLLSRSNRSGSDLAAFAQRSAAWLRGVEGRAGHRRTVLVGDFTHSPWEPPTVGGEGFHALMTVSLAERRDGRLIEGEPRPTFFNPMWQFLTDRGERPAGTYYRRASVPVNHYWYTLDHVLVRPELAGRLSRVEIIDGDGGESLLAPGGWPDTAAAGSDHLPLVFTLDD